jgi:ribonucleoside-diphosphate reductase alpha chain
MHNKIITKRNGEQEPFDVNKIHKVLEWATEGINGISISEIELKANIQISDGMATSDIHELLIISAAELISEHTPNYQSVAARLVNYKLRKQVYNQYEPWSLIKIVQENVNRGMYDAQVLIEYSESEFDQLDKYIKHDRDNDFTYVGMEQFRGKYLVQDRITRIPYETPQILYMLISMNLFMSYPKDTRMKYVKEYFSILY